MKINGYDVVEWQGFNIDELIGKYKKAQKEFGVTSVYDLPELKSAKFKKLAMRDQSLIFEMIHSEARYMMARDKKYVLSKAKFGVEQLPPPPNEKVTCSVRIDLVYYEMVMQKCMHVKFSENIREVIREWIDYSGYKQDFIDLRNDMMKKSKPGYLK